MSLSWYMDSTSIGTTDTGISLTVPGAYAGADQEPWVFVWVIGTAPTSVVADDTGIQLEVVYPGLNGFLKGPREIFEGPSQSMTFTFPGSSPFRIIDCQVPGEPFVDDSTYQTWTGSTSLLNAPSAPFIGIADGALANSSIQMFNYAGDDFFINAGSSAAAGVTGELFACDSTGPFTGEDIGGFAECLYLTWTVEAAPVTALGSWSTMWG